MASQPAVAEGLDPSSLWLSLLQHACAVDCVRAAELTSAAPSSLAVSLTLTAEELLARFPALHAAFRCGLATCAFVKSDANKYGAQGQVSLRAHLESTIANGNLVMDWVFFRPEGTNPMHYDHALRYLKDLGAQVPTHCKYCRATQCI